ncbi:RNA polymerase sigma-70 factor (ECF subfamily) [Actinokineospora baliensis]|uniref:sigma-70 family RNA polymerase sigma factor n=1 Tax=Actinokineospora baliensis TaxID=547056 RepID=UPI0019571827|nr:sigma-70 family RNA polymerase sigma factor [Actinokineospora baliensis]MBM7774736.1 RNA polymerase sigma-70 factor (ECF subfamily) [Actinokineospora baliensis]
MDDHDFLARRFEEHRSHLTAVAHRMLGSLTDTDDAVQETWLRLARTDTADIANLGGWLTTVVSRVCLDMLRARKLRQENPPHTHLPDPVVGDPEHQALIADSVGLALLVVLDSLSPPERLAFVLHDLFGLPFERIAPIMDRTPVAARKLASRARRRVQGAPTTATDPTTQRGLVDAFLTAARGGDLTALLKILDPDVTLRADASPGPMLVLRGAEAVAGHLSHFQRMANATTSHPTLVNGTPGLLNTRDGHPVSVMGFTTTSTAILEISILADPTRLSRLDLPAPWPANRR